MNNFCLGAAFICLPASISKVFGARFGTSVYSFVLFGSLISSMLNVLNAKFVLAPYGFFYSYIICVAATIVAILILSQFKEKLDVKRVFKLKN